MIRSVLTVIAALLVTPPLVLLTAAVALLRLPESTYDWITRRWTGALLAASGVPVRAEGLANLPRDRPLIIACDHQSWFDVAALAAVIPQRFRFVAKKELGQVPLWGHAWQVCGHIAVDRSDNRAAVQSLERAGALIRSDNSVAVIFPEGTRSGADEMLPFKKGAFRLATAMGVDMVPTAVVGSRDVLPRGGWRIRKRPITVRFGTPIPAADYGAENTAALMTRVRGAIEELRRAPAHSTEEDNAGDHEHSRA